jgi:alpha-1,6-mannosyltransferase
VWPNINRADYAPTIYPPAAQLIFFLITRIPAGVIGMKIGWLAFEGVTAWTVIRLLDHLRLPRARLLIYAWSPLVVWEVAGSGHLDAAMAALVVLAILARMRDRDGIAGVALGLAVLIKFFPLVALPALWRRWDWKLPAACVAVIAGGYALYLGAGLKVFGFLSGYSNEEGLRDGNGFWFAHSFRLLTGAPLSPTLYVAGVALLLGCLALVVVTSQDPVKPLSGALLLAATGMIALSPSHPWYFLWLTPLLCFAPNLPVLWITVAGPVLYWPNSYSAPWNSDVLYGGFCVLAFARLVVRFYTSHRSSEKYSDAY